MHSPSELSLGKQRLFTMATAHGLYNHFSPVAATVTGESFCLEFLGNVKHLDPIAIRSMTEMRLLPAD